MNIKINYLNFIPEIHDSRRLISEIRKIDQQNPRNILGSVSFAEEISTSIIFEINVNGFRQTLWTMSLQEGILKTLVVLKAAAGLKPYKEKAPVFYAR